MEQEKAIHDSNRSTTRVFRRDRRGINSGWTAESKVIGTVLMRLAKAGFCWKGVHVKSRGRRHDAAYSKPVNKGL